MAIRRGCNLACPYFVPREILNDGSWPHPSRLPLGAGWRGTCRASGQDAPIADTLLREFCNLGYATACPHLPPRCDWDAIRFSVARASREQITISFVCELGHAPRVNGQLTFDLASEAWLNLHPDARVLTLANCYLQTYRSRTPTGNRMQASGPKALDEECLNSAAETASPQNGVNFPILQTR